MNEEMGVTDSRPLIILVASGMQQYREYLLRSIGPRFRVHLLHTVEPSWEKPWLDGWTVVLDTCDGPAMAKVAEELDARTPVSGVLCWDEMRIHPAAYVAEALGLPGGDPAVLWRLRDKGQSRVALAAAGVPQPASRPVSDIEGALRAAEWLGYPVILKPRGLGASLGVIRADDPDALRAGFAFTSSIEVPPSVVYDSLEPYLVEECVSGEEISVDAVVRDGVVSAVFVARKVVGYPPYAEEIGHFVDASDPLLTDPGFHRVLSDTHAALGVRDGWTHSEFMLTADGPKVIEVNGRLGGDLIPLLGQLATGVAPGLAAASVACGREPELWPTRDRVAGVRFLYVDKDDSVIASAGFAKRLPGAVDAAVTLVTPGAVVSPPPKGTVWGRIAYVTATGASKESCRAALDAAEAAFACTTR